MGVRRTRCRRTRPARRPREPLERISDRPPAGILEVGANIGINLRALRCPTDAGFFAVEPNAAARAVLAKDAVVPPARILDGTASSTGLPEAAVDPSFTSGVLIHIYPDHLEASVLEIYRVTRRYVACIEYFSDKPRTGPYGGHDDKLFKRDFGGYWLDLFPDLIVRDYGFAWKRLTGLDNLTWWLFEKRG